MREKKANEKREKAEVEELRRTVTDKKLLYRMKKLEFLETIKFWAKFMKIKESQGKSESTSFML